MAIIPHTAVPKPDLTDFNGVRLRSWANMADGDVGEGIILTKFSDRTVQIEGTFGPGATVTFTGSNDGVNWRPLRDVFNAVVSATDARLITLTEVPLYIRPEVTGAGSTITVTVCAVGREP